MHQGECEACSEESKHVGMGCGRSVVVVWLHCIGSHRRQVSLAEIDCVQDPFLKAYSSGCLPLWVLYLMTSKHDELRVTRVYRNQQMIILQIARSNTST